MPRPAGRFTGEEAETKPGVAGGHIPGATNLPHSQLFNSDGTWKSPAELKALFEATGVDLSKPVVTSCGSGHDRIGAGLRAAPDRQERRRAVRRQLERMGRGPRHAQGNRGGGLIGHGAMPSLSPSSSGEGLGWGLPHSQPR